jgi:hypothetical protein
MSPLEVALNEAKNTIKSQGSKIAAQERTINELIQGAPLHIIYITKEDGEICEAGDQFDGPSLFQIEGRLG